MTSSSATHLDPTQIVSAADVADDHERTTAAMKSSRQPDQLA
jgi:hypothetical protein